MITDEQLDEWEVRIWDSHSDQIKMKDQLIYAVRELKELLKKLEWANKGKCFFCGMEEVHGVHNPPTPPLHYDGEHLRDCYYRQLQEAIK